MEPLLVPAPSFKSICPLSISFSTPLNISLPKFTKSSLIPRNSLNPQNPSTRWNNYMKPISYILPYIHKVQETSDSMMSVTAATAAKMKISPLVATLAANPTFVSGLFAWAVAQSMKVLLNFCVDRRWDFRLMFASGGMPSSHTALCTALTTSVAICHGVSDSLFPVCLGFTLVVMYDAIGVRRHAGMQAQVLNLIIEDLFQGHPISQRKLKELLGHTPLQVFAGALLGIMVACMCCQGCPFPL